MKKHSLSSTRLNYANRRNSAYLQQNSAENSEKTPNTRGSIATLDRRPNRPPFHHMGPLPASRRGGPPYVRYQNQRIQQQTNQQIGKRIGVLENMQEMITLAKNEIAVLRNLAKNITDDGKELNLWEILNAVNSTVVENPDSGIARLMRRYILITFLIISFEKKISILKKKFYFLQILFQLFV